MPNEERSWGVLFTSAGLSELGEEFQPYLEEESIGPFMICKEVDIGHHHLVRIVIDWQDPTDPAFELEYYVPYHYIKLIASGSSKEKLKRVIGFRGKN